MGAPVVFISYSHDDERWKNRLVKHLRGLEPEGLIEIWDDRRIAAGDAWLPEIEEAMRRAKVAVLLISANFLASKFILEREVPTLLQRYRKEAGLQVIPLIVSPCAWSKVSWLAPLQGRPTDGRPLSGRNANDKEAALTALAEEIHAWLGRRADQDALAVPEQGKPEIDATLIQPAEEIAATSTAPPPAKIARTGTAWLPRARFLIALVVVPLAVLPFAHRYNSSDIELVDIEFSCPPGQRKSAESYRKHLTAGRKAVAEMDTRSAKQEFNAALCIEDTPEARIGFAQALDQLGQIRKARRIAAKVFPENLPEEKRLLIEAQVSALAGRWRQAVNKYQELLGKRPGDLEVIVLLAQAQIAAGEPGAALTTVQKASSSKNPRLSFVSARAALAQGSSQLAADLLAVLERDENPFIAVQGFLLHAGTFGTHDSLNAFAKIDDAKVRAAGISSLSFAALGEEADLHLDRGHYQDALHSYLDAARVVRGNRTDSPLSAIRRNNLGNLYDMFGDLTKARHHLRIAYYDSRDYTFSDEADAANNMGLVLEHQGDLEGARWYLSQANSIYRQIKRKSAEAGTLCDLAQIDWLLLETSISVPEVRRCRELADSSGDQALSAAALATEGDLDLWLGDPDGALEKHKEALDRREKLGPQDKVADSHFSRAMAALEGKQLSEAKDHARKALTYFRDEKAEDWVAYAHVLLAQIDLERKDTSAAQQDLDQARQRASASEFLELRVRYGLTAARLAAAEKRFRDALDSANRVLDEAQRQHHPSFQLEAQLALGEIELLRGDSDNRGCKILEKVKEEARRDYGLVARKAEKLLAQPPCKTDI